MRFGGRARLSKSCIRTDEDKQKEENAEKDPNFSAPVSRRSKISVKPNTSRRKAEKKVTLAVEDVIVSGKDNREIDSNSDIGSTLSELEKNDVGNDVVETSEKQKNILSDDKEFKNKLPPAISRRSKISVKPNTKPRRDVKSSDEIYSNVSNCVSKKSDVPITSSSENSKLNEECSNANNLFLSKEFENGEIKIQDLIPAGDDVSNFENKSSNTKLLKNISSVNDSKTNSYQDNPVECLKKFQNDKTGSTMKSGKETTSQIFKTSDIDRKDVAASPSKTPILAMRLAARTKYPKLRPNIENVERNRKRLISINENDEEILDCADLLNDDKTPENRRKRHRSAANEAEDVRKKKRQYYRKGNKPPERSKMTMLDLIYWNPSSKPMTQYDMEQSVTKTHPTTAIEVDETQKTKLEEEAVDELNEPEDEENLPVPQIKIGPDGNIVVDEKTLIVHTNNKSQENVEKQPIVFERTSSTTYASFRRKGGPGLRKWTVKETAKFYQALCAVGTDFTMMTQLLPNRSRMELKKKFMKEDKLRKDLIDKAIRSGNSFDPEILELTDSEEEKAKSKKLKRNSKGKKRKYRKRKPTYDWSESEDGDIELATKDVSEGSDAVEEEVTSVETNLSDQLNCNDFKEIERKVSKVVSEHNNEEPVENVDSNEAIVDSNPATPAQLFLVAQKSPYQEEQIIHVYMVSPAGVDDVPSPCMTQVTPSIDQATPGITPLDNIRSPLQCVTIDSETENKIKLDAT